LTLHIPGTNVPIVYSGDVINENDIETLDILVFKIEDNGEHFFQHIPVSTGITNNGSSKKLSVKLQPLSVPVRLLVLANVSHLFTPDILNVLKSDSISGNVEKIWILNRFVFDFNEPWNLNKSEGREARAFPMYGESEKINTSSPEFADINMRRSVVRIDIGIGSETLEIDSVYLFNTPNKGFVAPQFDKNGVIIEIPHVPAHTIDNKGFAYKFIPALNDKGRIMEKMIYTTEDMQDVPTPTIIVVKARHNGGKYNYYRVDMLNKEEEMIPLLRNNRYRLNITNINGSGYASPEEALNAPTDVESQLEATVLDIHEYVSNDQYLMGVSIGKIMFNWDGSWAGALPEEKAFHLLVYTSYPQWSVHWIDEEPDWVEIEDENGNTITGTETFPSNATSLYIRILSPNTSGKMRTAKFKLATGTLRKEITVTQDN
jgi:hypothetical protein